MAKVLPFSLKRTADNSTRSSEIPAPTHDVFINFTKKVGVTPLEYLGISDSPEQTDKVLKRYRMKRTIKHYTDLAADPGETKDD